MERFTARDKNGSVFYPHCFEQCQGTPETERCINCEYYDRLLKKFAEYEDAKEQGLLHIAPLKNGTSIWHLEVRPFEEKVRVKRTTYLYGETEYSIGVLGIDFWTTREEAEQKLAEMRGVTRD